MRGVRGQGSPTTPRASAQTHQELYCIYLLIEALYAAESKIIAVAQANLTFPCLICCEVTLSQAKQNGV